MSSIKIAFVFAYSTDWIGGVYYIENIIKSLCFLPFDEQPIVVVFCEKTDDFDYLKSQTEYPKLEHRLLPVDSSYRTLRILRRLIRHTPKEFRDIDKFYLTNMHRFLRVIPSARFIFWLGDLQNRIYPGYFDRESLLKRKMYQDQLAEAKHIIASSDDMRALFLHLYPFHKCDISVFKFASIIPKQKPSEKSRVLQKYNLLDKAFYFVPNQFWAHKNHIILIEAMSILLGRNVGNIKIILSGKEYDHRNPDYFNSLKEKIIASDLDDHFQFLGFIPREEQLHVMSASVAVVQPSLYEGWSTVVEDAKALGKKVICSDIPVHYEQLGYNGVYFDPKNAAQLAGLLERYFKSPYEEPIDYNYPEFILQSARQFMNIMQA